MVTGPRVLVILDGASEPIDGDEPTSLERAATPVLDALAQLGTLHRVATTPDGLPAGSETGCAVLLGWTPPARVDRARLEASARGITLAAGEIAVRVDVREADGTRANTATTTRASAAASRSASGGARPATAHPSPVAAVHQLAGHRLLLTGTPSAVDAAVERLQQAAPAIERWPAGAVPPRQLDGRTVVIGAPGALTGLAALLGARVVTPPGVTGGAREHLGPLADAALAALHGAEADRIVVHVGTPDEAAHELDARGKARAIEAADEEVLLPIVAALHELGGVLEIAIDHGCDPATGRHDSAPTPFLRWDAAADTPPDPSDDAPAADPRDIDPEAPGLRSGLDPEDLPVMALPKRRATASARPGRRLTERWALPLPVEQPADVLADGRAGEARR